MTERNEEMDKENWGDKLKRLRKIIYFIESQNAHRKTPKNDSEMADEIIKQVQLFVEEED